MKIILEKKQKKQSKVPNTVTGMERLRTAAALVRSVSTRRAATEPATAPRVGPAPKLAAASPNSVNHPNIQKFNLKKNAYENHEISMRFPIKRDPRWGKFECTLAHEKIHLLDLIYDTLFKVNSVLVIKDVLDTIKWEATSKWYFQTKNKFLVLSLVSLNDH